MVMGGRKGGGEQQKQFHLLATVLPGTSVGLLIFFILQINNMIGLYGKLIYEVLSELQYCMLSPIPGTLDFCVYAHVYIYVLKIIIMPKRQ